MAQVISKSQVWDFAMITYMDGLMSLPIPLESSVFKWYLLL